MHLKNVSASICPRVRTDGSEVNIEFSVSSKVVDVMMDVEGIGIHKEVKRGCSHERHTYGNDPFRRNARILS